MVHSFVADDNGVVRSSAIQHHPSWLAKSAQSDANPVRNPNATLVSQYPAEEHSDAETRRAPHTIPHGTRAELGDAVKAKLTSYPSRIAVKAA